MTGLLPRGGASASRPAGPSGGHQPPDPGPVAPAVDATTRCSRPRRFLPHQETCKHRGNRTPSRPFPRPEGALRPPQPTHIPSRPRHTRKPAPTPPAPPPPPPPLPPPRGPPPRATTDSHTKPTPAHTETSTQPAGTPAPRRPTQRGNSPRGGFFRAPCELTLGSARVEVEDMGGPWRTRKDGDRPHGLDIVEALTGPDGWGPERTQIGRASC